MKMFVFFFHCRKRLFIKIARLVCSQSKGISNTHKLVRKGSPVTRAGSSLGSRLEARRLEAIFVRLERLEARS